MSGDKFNGTQHAAPVDADALRRAYPGFIPALHEADELTQTRTEKILLLLSFTTRALASGTPTEHRDGLRLLELVADEVSGLENEINSLDERNGVSHFREGDTA